VSENSNPWVSRPETVTQKTAEPLHERIARPSGPVAPQRGVPVPDRVDQLAVFERTAPAELWWLGTHGGAGESSLSALVPEWSAADHAWPMVRDQLSPSRVVLTARSNVRGLRAAQVAATQWASGLVPFVDVVGLVVVADAPGRLPRPLRDLTQVVGGGMPRVWHVPWIEPWRLGERPSLPESPREVRRLVDDLRVLLQPGAEGTTY